jgi:hypothetical protein
LKANLLKALASVGLDTIWQWEHQTFRWMNTYRENLETKDAQ